MWNRIRQARTGNIKARTARPRPAIGIGENFEATANEVLTKHHYLLILKNKPTFIGLFQDQVFQEIDMQPKTVSPSTVGCPHSVALKEKVRRIGLVGHNIFQNRLLKSILESQLGQDCRVETVAEWLRGEATGTPAWDLVLWDSYTLEPGEVGIRLRLGEAPNPIDQAIALFNVEPAAGIAFERRAIEWCIRGIFYVDEPLERFLKGVQLMLQGELWFSRKTTSTVLMDSNFRRPGIVAAEAMLTGREKEILNAIASGASNNDIAAACFISPHTVKAHLYNIYRKIGVKNRLEATLWVARYL